MKACTPFLTLFTVGFGFKSENISYSNPAFSNSVVTFCDTLNFNKSLSVTTNAFLYFLAFTSSGITDIEPAPKYDVSFSIILLIKIPPKYYFTSLFYTYKIKILI